MIRINLLPFRLARKKENIRRQVSIFFLSLVLVGMGLTYHALSMEKKIEKRNKDTARIKQEIALYQAKAAKVREIQKRIQILEDKFKIIESLKTRRNEQISLLMDLPGRIVKERMWIENLAANETSVTMTGVAFDNPTIADFMKNLEASDIFADVDLKRSVIRKFRDDLELKSFELVCRKKQTPVEADTGAKGGKKKGRKKK